MSRILAATVAILLVAGIMLSLEKLSPGIYPARSVPVPENDWKWLNGE